MTQTIMRPARFVGSRGCSCPRANNVLRRPAPPARPAARRIAVSSKADSSSDELQVPKISVPKSRRAASPPPPVSIVHSSTYTLEEDLGSVDDGYLARYRERTYDEQELSSSDYDNPVEYMLQRADESLAKAEQSPPQAAKVFWDVARGPVGKTASRGLRGVMNVSVEVGKGAVTAAAPVAKWAAKEGAKAVFSAVAKGVQGGTDKPKQLKEGSGAPNDKKKQ